MYVMCAKTQGKDQPRKGKVPLSKLKKLLRAGCFIYLPSFLWVGESCLNQVWLSPTSLSGDLPALRLAASCLGVTQLAVGKGQSQTKISGRQFGFCQHVQSEPILPLSLSSKNASSISQSHAAYLTFFLYLSVTLAWLFSLLN